MDQNNLILIEQHLFSNGHDFSGDTQFTIIERIVKV